MDADQTFLVTAASSGLGAEMATGLAKPGRHLIIHYHRNRDGAERVAETITARGGAASVVSADLTDPSATNEMTERVGSEHERLDVLVNNFGPYIRNRWDEYTNEEWQLQIEGTISATFRVTRNLIDLLRAAPRATIINLSDCAADRVTAHEPDLPYYVGKTGIVMLTQTIARAEAAHGITANSLMPGVMENSELKPDVERIPVGRFGTADDLVGAIEFLIGARYVTGSSIQVGGGWKL
ncbi:MAG: SDR family oxidoreductase [Acidimicrobiia bacterium]|nr:SDR family oxidoreductase [Acidimicrobiia bacterium]